MIKAARAMYPVSSKREIKKNKIRMFGRKTRTPPTPAIIPSTIMSEIIPAGSMSLTNSPNKAIPFSIHSCGNAPKVNVVSNIIHKNKNRIGNPNHLFVRSTSIAYESSAFLSLFLWNVSFRAPRMKPYFAFVMTDVASSPNSSSISILHFSAVSRIR